MSELLAIQERIWDREEEHAYNVAMRQAQQDMPQIHAADVNTHTKSSYAKLHRIIRAITPVYTHHGFSLSFSQVDSPLAGHIRIECEVSHIAGHTKQKFLDLPVVDTGIKGEKNMTLTHAQGSAFSYARRYLTLMVFNLATGDDDDGNAAGTVEYASQEQISRLHTLFDKSSNEKWVKDTKEWLHKAHGVADIELIPANKFEAIYRAVFAATGLGDKS